MGFNNIVSSSRPSTMEVFLGGDTYQGQYVPPLMAKVMKEMQAEEAAKAAKAGKASKADVWETPAGALATPPVAPRVQLGAETVARLDAIRSAPTLSAALDLAMRFPELHRLAEEKGLVELCQSKVPDRQAKAREAGSMLLIEGNSNAARYFGVDVSLFAAMNPFGKSVAIGLTQTKLYGAADLASDSWRILTQDDTRRVRTGFARHLPWQVGPDAVSAALPGLTPATLAAGIAHALGA